MSNSLIVRYIYFFCIDKFNFYGISVRWQHHYREYEVVAFHFLPRLQKLQYLSFVTTPKWWVCSILQPFYMLQNYLGWLNCQQRTAATLGQVWILWEPSDDPGPGPAITNIQN